MPVAKHSWGLCARRLTALNPHTQTFGVATVIAPLTSEETESLLPGGGRGAGTHPVQCDSGVLVLTGHAGQRGSSFWAVDGWSRVGLALLSFPSQVPSYCLVLPSAPGCWL